MKELIIIVYKINVEGQNRSTVEQMISNLHSAYSLTDDNELKENYIIREMWLPVEQQSDIQVIYPVPRYTTSPEINDLVEEISNRIKEDPTNTLSQHWKKLVRELKLRKINEQS